MRVGICCLNLFLLLHVLRAKLIWNQNTSNRDFCNEISFHGIRFSEYPYYSEKGLPFSYFWDGRVKGLIL